MLPVSELHSIIIKYHIFLQKKQQIWIANMDWLSVPILFYISLYINVTQKDQSNRL